VINSSESKDFPLQTLELAVANQHAIHARSQGKGKIILTTYKPRYTTKIEFFKLVSLHLLTNIFKF